jgi:hypothetical protein
MVRAKVGAHFSGAGGSHLRCAVSVFISAVLVLLLAGGADLIRFARKPQRAILPELFSERDRTSLTRDGVAV